MPPLFNDLTFAPQRRHRRKGRVKTVRGFDTENRPGKPASVLCSDEVGSTVASLDDILAFLTKKPFRDSLNFFYNLGFDVESMFKYEPEVLLELVELGQVEYKGYCISYIPKRKLTIKTGAKQKYIYYDVAQYFMTSLAQATKKYLGREVHELKGDRDKLFELYEVERIIDYCIQDARDTMDLGVYLQQALQEINFQAEKYTSVGSLAEQYLLQKAQVPLLNHLPLSVAQACYQSYYGGWFELIKRGRFDCYGYDITSAYPYKLRDLPDIRDGRWYQDFDENDEWGVVQVKVQKSESLINPLGFRAQSMVVYPTIDEPVERWITVNEYKTFKDVYDFEILDAYVFRSNWTPRKPFRKAVNTLFKLKSESEKGSARYMASKLIMNSMYGKTIQRTERPEGFVTGNMFNPFYAAEITAHCRCMMWEAIKNNLDDIIMIATDGVFSTKPLDIEIGEGLGQWTEECDNKDAVFVGSGIYQLEGKAAKGRGLGRDLDLFSVLDTKEEVVQISKLRPVHIKECAKQHRLEDVANFEEINRSINVTPDIKRLWKGEPEQLRDLLEEQFESVPIPVSFAKLTKIPMVTNTLPLQDIKEFPEGSGWDKLKGTVY